MLDNLTNIILSNNQGSHFPPCVWIKGKVAQCSTAAHRLKEKVLDMQSEGLMPSVQGAINPRRLSLQNAEDQGQEIFARVTVTIEAPKCLQDEAVHPFPSVEENEVVVDKWWSSSSDKIPQEIKEELLIPPNIQKYDSWCNENDKKILLDFNKELITKFNAAFGDGFLQKYDREAVKEKEILLGFNPHKMESSILFSDVRKLMNTIIGREKSKGTKEKTGPECCEEYIHFIHTKARYVFPLRGQELDQIITILYDLGNVCENLYPLLKIYPAVEKGEENLVKQEHRAALMAISRHLIALREKAAKFEEYETNDDAEKWLCLGPYLTINLLLKKIHAVLGDKEPTWLGEKRTLPFINSKNAEGKTRLHEALSEEGYFDFELISFLLKNGANPEIEDNNGNNAFSILEQRITLLTEQVDMLLEEAKKGDDSSGLLKRRIALLSEKAAMIMEASQLLDNYK